MKITEEKPEIVSFQYVDEGEVFEYNGTYYFKFHGGMKFIGSNTACRFNSFSLKSKQLIKFYASDKVRPVETELIIKK